MIIKFLWHLFSFLLGFLGMIHILVNNEYYKTKYWGGEKHVHWYYISFATLLILSFFASLAAEYIGERGIDVCVMLFAVLFGVIYWIIDGKRRWKNKIHRLR